MFWAGIVLLGFVLFGALPVPGLIVLAIAIFISTASVVIASRFLIGKVSFGNAFKANALGTLSFFLVFVFSNLGGHSDGIIFLLTLALAVVAMLFVYSQYLNSTMIQSFIVILVAGVVNSGCIWLLGSTMNLGLKFTGNA